MALLTGWLYYWGRVKFHDLRAEMTNTPCIAFTLLEQVLFSWINNQTTGFKIKSQLLAWIGRLFLAYFFPAVNNDITFFHFPWRLCLWPVTKIFPNWNFTFFFEKPWKNMYDVILKRFRTKRMLWTAKIMSPSEYSFWLTCVSLQPFPYFKQSANHGTSSLTIVTWAEHKHTT